MKKTSYILFAIIGATLLFCFLLPKIVMRPSATNIGESLILNPQGDTISIELDDFKAIEICGDEDCYISVRIYEKIDDNGSIRRQSRFKSVTEERPLSVTVAYNPEITTPRIIMDKAWEKGCITRVEDETLSILVTPRSYLGDHDKGYDEVTISPDLKNVCVIEVPSMNISSLKALEFELILKGLKGESMRINSLNTVFSDCSINTVEVD